MFFSPVDSLFRLWLLLTCLRVLLFFFVFFCRRWWVQFVNLFLFFVGISFVVAAVLMVCATSPFKDRWDTYANVPLQVRFSRVRSC